MTLSLLGSATWSVPDFVRTDLRTVRLAIVKGDRSDRVMHPRKSQVTTIRLMRSMETRKAVLVQARTRRSISPSPEERTSKLGRIIRCW